MTAPGVGLPLCPGRHLPDGVHARSDPVVLTPTYQIPALTISGSPDDVMRVSRIAETLYTQQGLSVHRVALVEGINHGDIMDIHDAVNQMDLPSEIGSEATRAAVADLIVGFAAGSVATCTASADCISSATPMCNGSIRIAMPCGDGSFILVGTHDSLWDSVKPMTGSAATTKFAPTTTSSSS